MQYFVTNNIQRVIMATRQPTSTEIILPIFKLLGIDFGSIYRQPQCYSNTIANNMEDSGNLCFSNAAYDEQKSTSRSAHLVKRVPNEKYFGVEKITDKQLTIEYNTKKHIGSLRQTKISEDLYHFTSKVQHYKTSNDANVNVEYHDNACDGLRKKCDNLIKKFEKLNMNNKRYQMKYDESKVLCSKRFESQSASINHNDDEIFLKIMSTIDGLKDDFEAIKDLCDEIK